VIGDSACIFDAFYSLGSTMIVSAIDSITEIIRAELAGEVNAAEKCQTLQSIQSDPDQLD
jgi:hypothetical protein